MARECKISGMVLTLNSEDHIRTVVGEMLQCGVDEIVVCDTGSTDATAVMAEQAGAKVVHYVDPSPIEIDGEKFISDFAAARNFATSKCEGDFVFWLDSDDVVSNPTFIKNLLNTIRKIPEEFDIVRMTYDYAFDGNGRCILAHPQDRIYKVSKFVWRSPIHEVLCSTSPIYQEVIPEDQCKIIHNYRPGDRAIARKRNLAISEKYIKDNDGKVEARQWLNYGKGLYAESMFAECIEPFEKYIADTSRADEKYHARILQARAFHKLGRAEEGIAAALKAIDINPEWKEAFACLCELYNLIGEHKKAVYWGERWDTTEETNDYADIWYDKHLGALRPLIFSYAECGEIDKAIKTADRFLKLDPTATDIIGKRTLCTHAVRETELVKSFKKLMFYIHCEQDKDKEEALFKACPEAIKDHPEVMAVPAKRRVTGMPRIIFFCGASERPWGPSAISRGVGGSETAVIEVAEIFAAKGWDVEVYNFCPHEDQGEVNGVIWRPYWMCPKAPPADIAVCWRVPSGHEWIPAGTKAVYYWGHDVCEKSRWSKETLAAYKKLILLSKAHRHTYDWVPEDKILYSANGVSSLFLNALDDTIKTQNRLIYASCPSRGLAVLLEDWPRIKAEVPEAVLEVYYGFQPHYFNTMRHIPGYKAAYDKVMRLLKQEGVEYYGMVGQAELAKAFSRAAIWAYPCTFYEISCITAMQAQAAGAIPVCSGFAALTETVKYGKVIGGVKATGDEYDVREKIFEAIVDLLKKPYEQNAIRRDMVPYAKETFVWSKVVKPWEDEFLTTLSASKKQAVKEAG